jgi:tRNA nucleotidyltransferase (CCA-adding enzyme)
VLKRIQPADIPAPVIELCRALAKHGQRGWVVGGCLRDLLRGQPASDWDLATDARPEQVQAIFPRVIPTGIQHGTVTVRHRGGSYELTTLRGEGAYSDGRRPDSVEFVSDIVDDLSRRDFTVNAIAYDPVLDQLDDPHGGLDDLARRLLRAVGEPQRRFGEDGLRVLRAARFAATLEFELDPATEQAIRPSLATFQRVSAERVRDEWVKALKARAPSRAFAVMRRTGILEVTYPALAELPDRLWSSSLAAIDETRSDPCLRLAALLFALRDDAALPGSHEPSRSATVAQWLTRYRFSNQERERVLRLLAHAWPRASESFSDADVRRYARDVGRAHVAEVIELGINAARAFEGAGSLAERRAQALQARVHEVVRPETPLTARELALGGRDLMTELGVEPGPRVGQLIDALLASVLDDPRQNTREQLLATARARLVLEAHGGAAHEQKEGES